MYRYLFYHKTDSNIIKDIQQYSCHINIVCTHQEFYKLYQDSDVIVIYLTASHYQDYITLYHHARFDKIKPPIIIIYDDVDMIYHLENYHYDDMISSGSDVRDIITRCNLLAKNYNRFIRNVLIDKTFQHISQHSTIFNNDDHTVNVSILTKDHNLEIKFQYLCEQLNINFYDNDIITKHDKSISFIDMRDDVPINIIKQPHHHIFIAIIEKNNIPDIFTINHLDISDIILYPCIDDIVIKSIQRLTYMITMYDNILQYYQQSIHDALYDPLTKVHNRRYLQQYCDYIFSQKTKKTYLFLMIDIDNFKQINDTYGHTAGDDILIETASALSSNMRDNDMIFRYGGDEFIVVYSDITIESFEHIMARIHYNMPVDISIGHLMHHTMCDDTSFEELLKKLDTALYKTKKLHQRKK